MKQDISVSRVACLIQDNADRPAFGEIVDIQQQSAVVRCAGELASWNCTVYPVSRWQRIQRLASESQARHKVWFSHTS